MCGRFALHNFYLNRVADEYPDVPPRRWDDEEQFHPRYNVAPQTHVPVIMQQPNGQGQQDLVVQTMRWGLQAKWNDPNSSSYKNPINARSEVVLEGSAKIWNSVRGTKHCVIVCEGYYEWLKKGGMKIPHYVKHPQNHLLLLAGFYEIVNGTDPPRTYTCTILTTDPNSQLAFLHDRMPVILSGKQALEWLDVGDGWRPEVLKELRKPYAGQLVCYEVPSGVGKVGNEDPSFVEPISDRKDGLKAMLSRVSQKSKEIEKQTLGSSSTKTPKSEPTEVLSDDSDVVEDVKPKAEPKSSPIKRSARKLKSEPEHVVLDDESDIEVEDSKTKVEPKSSPLKSSSTSKSKGHSLRRGSSPVEFEIVSSGSEDKVPIGARRKKRKVEKGSSPTSDKRRLAKPACSNKNITDFFGKK